MAQLETAHVWRRKWGEAGRTPGGLPARFGLLRPFGELRLPGGEGGKLLLLPLELRFQARAPRDRARLAPQAIRDGVRAALRILERVRQLALGIELEGVFVDSFAPKPTPHDLPALVPARPDPAQIVQGGHVAFAHQRVELLLQRAVSSFGLLAFALEALPFRDQRHVLRHEALDSFGGRQHHAQNPGQVPLVGSVGRQLARRTLREPGDLAS